MKMMTKLKTWYRRLDRFARGHYWSFWLWVFVVVRCAMVFLPGPGYSDVTHYYERYANVWEYGLPPYTHSVFEYGPIASGAIWLPLKIDIAGVGKYYYNYKLLCLICELGLWSGLLWWAKTKRDSETAPLLLYIVLTTLARNWLYEGIDMIFASVAVGAILLLSVEKRWARWMSWLLLWVSTAVKFLTLPLIAPWYLITRGKWKQSVATVIVTFLIIWGIPAAMYRSSLSVPFVYNGGRTTKYNTITHLIIRTVNNVTDTEVQSEEAPDYSFSGPMSSVAAKVLLVLYPVSLLTILLAEGLYIYRLETGKWWDKPTAMIKRVFQPTSLTADKRTQTAAWCYLAYFLVSFVTAKIYSNPFLLWILPLIVIMKWSTGERERLFWKLMSAWTILELTPFLTAGFWRLQRFPWFRYELFEVTYGWVKWMVIGAVIGVVFREMWERVKGEGRIKITEKTTN